MADHLINVSFVISGLPKLLLIMSSGHLLQQHYMLGPGTEKWSLEMGATVLYLPQITHKMYIYLRISFTL